MNDFESRLKDIPLRSPSSELDDRILSETARHRAEVVDTTRRISLGWAVAASLAACFLGFLGGLSWQDARSPESTATPVPIQVRVIYEPSLARDPFDLSKQPEPLLGRDVQTRVLVRPVADDRSNGV